MLLYNANIITMDPRFPFAEWAVIADGIIQAIGVSSDYKGLEYSKIEPFDCGGRTILPGLIDAHLHLSAFAESCVSLSLSWTLGFNSIADIQYSIKAQSKKAPPGAWIRGKGYDEFYLSEKRHPTRWDLDRAAPDNPVKITHRSGHAHVLNTKALSLVGISVESGDPPGGLIDRDLTTGEPTGLLYEMSAFLSERIPQIDNQELLRGLCIANQKLISSGITSVQDASHLNDLNKVKKIASWKKEGLLTPRINIMLGQKGFEQFGETNSSDFSDLILKDQFSIGGIKVILDETTGELHPSQMELNKMILKFHQAGFQVAIHAIEENAVESACNAIEYALE
ncbi:MAG: amidohydrolase family protein, partial [Anaerolineales bacterium]|nr:amidohydrolase family protein [Anaerolineales bacterium]